MRNNPGESTTSPLFLLCLPIAHRTAAYAAQEIAGFERLRRRQSEHLPHSGEPEAVFIGEVVAGTSAMAFKERIVAESPEARAGRGESLPTTAATGSSVLERKRSK